MVSFEKYTETEIIGRILDREKALYEIIVRRYNPLLYKIGRSYNYHHQDTQDLMQETFIDAYKNLLQFEGRANFKTWIIRIMMNNCYRKKGKLSYKNEFTDEIKDNATPMFSRAKIDGEKDIQNGELGRIIEDALSKLPHDYRMTFSLREINGLSVIETADLLSITETNVKVRLNRAKAMLRKEIERSYTANELFEFNLIYCDAVVTNVMKIIHELE